MKKFLTILMAMFMAVSFSACGGENNGASSSGDSLSEGQHEDNTAEPKPNSAQNEKGKIGDFEVAILKSEVTTSENGKKAMLVTYSFTNNSNGTVKFDDVLSADAYQNNTACKQTGTFDELETMLTEIRAGETRKVMEAYFLQDDSEVTVRVSKAGQTTEQEDKDSSMVVRTFKVQ